MTYSMLTFSKVVTFISVSLNTGEKLEQRNIKKREKGRKEPM
jgi:hypothetical protein